MFPEISRRCLVCGASARAAAKFCPQCGGDLAGHEDEADADKAATGQAEEAGTGRADEAAPPTREHKAFGAEGGHGPVPLTREHRVVPDAASEAAVGSAPPTREAAAFGAEAERGDVPPTREHAGPGAEMHRIPARPVGRGEAGRAAGGAETRRVRTAARVRGVKENLGPRVGRMRDEALVVLDETPDDSGLRFVLIALGLFAVSAVFLVLSLYVLG